MPGEVADRVGVVLAVEFALQVTDGQSMPLAFAQLATALGVPEGERVPLSTVRSTVLQLRAAKGMVLDAADPDTRSAGSFFTNPIVSARIAAGLPSDAPRWPVDPDQPDLVIPLGELANYAHLLSAPIDDADQRVKLSAAWLIEHAGIAKGYSIFKSRAAVSSKHTLALTNRGGATADEIAQLARLIQSRVQSEFGVWLQPEPVCINVEL
ncbi:MAG: UDP-N-acetylmuramate dehydrogenase, partial [Agromyces sp.]